MSILIKYHKIKINHKNEKIQIKNVSDLIWLASSNFQFDKSGLFLVDGSSKISFLEDVKELGKFKAEGLLNHYHLNEITKNVNTQFLIGVKIIKNWILYLNEIKNIQLIVIYLNFNKTFTLCVYSNPSENDLRQLDKQFSKATPIKTTSAKKFLKKFD